jgi:hypothetical protein
MLTPKLIAFLIAFGSPFVLWTALYLMARRSPDDMRPIVPWVGVLRWISWLITVALFMTHLMFERFPAKYPFLSLGFTAGVMLMDLWAKSWSRRERASNEQAAVAAPR